MKYIKYFESSKDKDLTDTSNSWITSSVKNYENIEKHYKIDKEDIRNIFQEILDIYPSLVMDIMYYHPTRGFNIYFYDFQNRYSEGSRRKIRERYGFSEEVLEEINDRLEDFGLRSKLEYDSHSRYFEFGVTKI